MKVYWEKILSPEIIAKLTYGKDASRFNGLNIIIKEINDEKYKHKYFASEIILSPYGKFTHNERIDSYLWKDNFGKFVALCTQIYLEIFPDDFRSENKKIEFWKGIDSFSFFQLRIPHLDIDSDIAFAKETIVEFENKILPFLESKVRKIERIKHAATNNSYVYVLSNKSHPSIYKIGSTNGTPKDRAAELSSTGVLHPFKVSFQIEIKNAEYYEKSIHRLLKDYRVKQSREFFKFDLSKIKDSCNFYEISFYLLGIISVFYLFIKSIAFLIF